MATARLNVVADGFGQNGKNGTTTTMVLGGAAGTDSYCQIRFDQNVVSTSNIANFGKFWFYVESISGTVDTQYAQIVLFSSLSPDYWTDAGASPTFGWDLSTGSILLTVNGTGTWVVGWNWISLSSYSPTTSQRDFTKWGFSFETGSGGAYTVTIRTREYAGYGPYCDANTYLTPPTVTANVPSTTTVGVNQNFTATWTFSDPDTGDAQTYYLAELATDAGFTANYRSYTGSTAASVLVSGGLPVSGTWYYRVTVKDKATPPNQATSATVNFTIQDFSTPPNAPTWITAQDTTINIPSTVAFVFSDPNANDKMTAYEYIIYSDAACTQQITTAKITSSTASLFLSGTELGRPLGSQGQDRWIKVRVYDNYFTPNVGPYSVALHVIAKSPYRGVRVNAINVGATTTTSTSTNAWKGTVFKPARSGLFLTTVAFGGTPLSGAAWEFWTVSSATGTFTAKIANGVLGTSLVNGKYEKSGLNIALSGTTQHYCLLVKQVTAGTIILTQLMDDVNVLSDDEVIFDIANKLAYVNTAAPAANTSLTSTAHWTYDLAILARWQEPPVISFNPAIPSVTSSIPTSIGWNYSDPDGDTQGTYRVEIATDSGFTAYTYDSGTVTSAVQSAAIPGATFPHGGTYYIRLTVQDSFSSPAATSQTATIQIVTDIAGNAGGDSAAAAADVIRVILLSAASSNTVSTTANTAISRLKEVRGDTGGATTSANSSYGRVRSLAADVGVQGVSSAYLKIAVNSYADAVSTANGWVYVRRDLAIRVDGLLDAAQIANLSTLRPIVATADGVFTANAVIRQAVWMPPDPSNIEVWADVPKPGTTWTNVASKTPDWH